MPLADLMQPGNARTFGDLRIRQQNRCPFGCEHDDLEETTNYCRHLIGFTSDGKIMYRRKRRLMKRTNEVTGAVELQPSEFMWLDGRHPEPIPKKAKVDWITGDERTVGSNGRVYAEEGMPDYAVQAADTE